jgi:hypothetical protein
MSKKESQSPRMVIEPMIMMSYGILKEMPSTLGHIQFFNVGGLGRKIRNVYIP